MTSPTKSAPPVAQERETKGTNTFVRYLLCTPGKYCFTLQDGVTNQRQRLSNELGLTVGNVKLSTTEDLFDDSDLVQSEQNNHTSNLLAETKQVRTSGEGDISTFFLSS